MKLLNYFKYLFVLSGIVLLLGIASLAIFGLRLGIDFKGGTVTELQFKQPYEQNKVLDVLHEKGISNPPLQPTDNNGLIIRTESLEKEKYDEIANDIKSKVGDFTEKKFDSIGPIVGEELKRKALYQLVL